MTEQPSEQELIERFAKGDTDAFQSLYDIYQPFILRICWMHGCKDDDAIDITQEVWIKVSSYLTSGRYNASLGKLGPWLKKVAQHMAIDQLRRRSRQKHLQLSFDADLLDDSASSEHKKTGQTELVLQAVAELPGPEAMIIRLHYIQGLPIKQIAETLQLSPLNVCNKLVRARRMLEKTLKSNACDPESAVTPPTKEDTNVTAATTWNDIASNVDKLVKKLQDAPAAAVHAGSAQEKAARPQCDSRLVLRARLSEFAPEDEVADELVNLYRALNAYHIACGGSGLEIDDWQSFVLETQEAEVL